MESYYTFLMYESLSTPVVTLYYHFPVSKLSYDFHSKVYDFQCLRLHVNGTYMENEKHHVPLN